MSTNTTIDPSEPPYASVVTVVSGTGPRPTIPEPTPASVIPPTGDSTPVVAAPAADLPVTGDGGALVGGIGALLLTIGVGLVLLGRRAPNRPAG